MRVRVLLFGPAAAAAGCSEVTVTVAPPATCRSLQERIAAEHAALRPFVPVSRLAVNQEFGSADQPIRETDEVALIGLVSGG